MADREKWSKARELREKFTQLEKLWVERYRTKRDLSNDELQLGRALERLDSQKTHRCIWLRNDYITKRIHNDFARRQRKLSRLAEQDQHKYDGSVNVFPVCAKAFRDLVKGKKPMAGFPSKPYTGIPQLRQWFGEAVLARRETHLDAVLRGLQRLHDGITRWSDDSSRGMVAFSRNEVESLLRYSHDKYRSVGPARAPATVAGPLLT